MNSDELIGKVAAEYLRARLTDDDAAGVARYLLDCLTADQTAAIAKTILADASLSQLVEIKLPIHFVGEHGLPTAALTTERTTYWRSASCNKSALLLANTGDDEEQSLKDLVPIGAPQLQAHPGLWVGLAADGLPITDQHRGWWIKAIEGLLEVRSFALDRFAEYILQTQKAIDDGQPILFALGMAFPALQVPRDTAFFHVLNDKTAGHLSKWKGLAGSTGSGKSVLMQNIVLGIACTNTPEQAKIVLIDPKLGVDYFAFEGMPHLQDGIIDDQDKAIAKLEELVGEMNRRYAVLKANKVANIFDLNKKPDATERLPFLWIIHDEFAEWMMTESYAGAVSDIVSRLGVKARAAGISLVFAAQRPDANVMPMQLRSNLGNRLVLRVDGEGTSEIALGEKGAERLLGKGHIAAKLEGEPQIVFGQVPFVDDGFISSIVSSLIIST